MSTLRQLWVEGYSDKRFIQSIQRDAQLSNLFDVKFPGESSQKGGKPSVLKIFETLLKEAGEPSRYERLGLCIDADSPPDSGFKHSEKTISELLASTGFRMIDNQKRLYRHSNSHCIASYWISPSHADDGYSEGAAIQSLSDSEQIYLDQFVRPFIIGIKNPRFNSRNTNRALLYTYLAIQVKPDKSMATLLDENLLDSSKSPIALFANWMRGLFS
jgi:hypothetical protein